MWRKVLTPTLLVILVWLVVGGATTFYIQWLSESQSRTISENVATIQSVAELENTLLKIHSLTRTRTAPGEESPAAQLDRLTAQFQQQLAEAEKSASTPQESLLFTTLRDQFAALRGLFRREGVFEPPVHDSRPASQDEVSNAMRELTMALTDSSQQLVDINERLLSEAASQRDSVTRVVIPIRIGFMVLGPALGILIGVWIAWGLRHSIARISVTLSAADGSLEHVLGKVTVTPASDIPALEQQVQVVGQRLRALVDELQEARQQLVRSERLAAVGQLAAGIAHEIRNPLTSVKLLIQAAARRSATPMLTEKQSWVVQEEIARMENTIQGLLDFSRPTALKRVRHDLRDTVRRAVGLVEGRAKQIKTSIVLRLPDSPVMLDGDPEQIHQVFVNLLLNAIEAVGLNGHVEVIIEMTTDPTSPGCRVLFRDSGQGIPATVVGQIFEPFVTSKERGTGLGLALSRRIIEEHGGTIDAANRPEGGAEFVVRLPFTSVLASRHDEPPERH
jgi:two-component system, NtrC family, sensor histidine kinase HydH